MSIFLNDDKYLDVTAGEAIKRTLPMPGEVWSTNDDRMFVCINQGPTYANCLFLREGFSRDCVEVVALGKSLYTNPGLLTYVFERAYGERLDALPKTVYDELLEAVQSRLTINIPVKQAPAPAPVVVPEPAPVVNDVVNHPAHYTQGPVEVIDIIEGFNLSYHLGNVIKYVLRHQHKGKPLEDLKKAQWYLNREVSHMETKS